GIVARAGLYPAHGTARFAGPRRPASGKGASRRQSQPGETALDQGEGPDLEGLLRDVAHGARAWAPALADIRAAGFLNVGESWSQGHATMMIMGDTCTRGCTFCNVAT